MERGTPQFRREPQLPVGAEPGIGPGQRLHGYGRGTRGPLQGMQRRGSRLPCPAAVHHVRFHRLVSCATVSWLFSSSLESLVDFLMRRIKNMPKATSTTAEKPATLIPAISAVLRVESDDLVVWSLSGVGSTFAVMLMLGLPDKDEEGLCEINDVSKVVGRPPLTAVLDPLSFMQSHSVMDSDALVDADPFLAAMRLVYLRRQGLTW